MKKILVIILLAVLVSGLVFAVSTKVKIINFGQEKKDKLMEKGIGKKEIRNETCIEFNVTNGDCLKIDNSFLGYDNSIISSCKKKDEFKCKSKIYQRGGINKDIEITTKYCQVYIQEEINNMMVNTTECDVWKVLSQEEIEEEMEKKTEELFEQIIAIQESRNERVQEELTDNLEVLIE